MLEYFADVDVMQNVFIFMLTSEFAYRVTRYMINNAVYKVALWYYYLSQPEIIDDGKIDVALTKKYDDL